MTEYKTIKVEVVENIARLTVNRPEALNALNRTVLEEIRDAATTLAKNDKLDAVIVTGEGRAFVAGADIKAMLGFSAEEAEAFSRLGHEAFDAVAAIPCPVIAAVNGFALGGGLELALACDLLYASEKAKLGVPEVGLSVIPGWGGTQRLGRLIGWHHAKELVFTGKMVRAEEAKAMGLVLDVFPLDEFQASIDRVVASIVKNGPLALRAAKAAMQAGADSTLAAGCEKEKAAFGGLFGTADQKEGMTAFVEGRAATFTRS